MKMNRNEKGAATINSCKKKETVFDNWAKAIECNLWRLQIRRISKIPPHKKT